MPAVYLSKQQEREARATCIRDKKTSHYLELNGEVHTAAEWSRIRGWDPNIIYGRIRMGWSDERILTEEIAKKNPR